MNLALLAVGSGVIADTTTVPNEVFSSATVNMCEGDVVTEFSFGTFHVGIGQVMTLTPILNPRLSLAQRCDPTLAVAPRLCYNTTLHQDIHGLFGDDDNLVCMTDFLIDDSIAPLTVGDPNLQPIDNDVHDPQFSINTRSDGCRDLPVEFCAQSDERICHQPECVVASLQTVFSGISEEEFTPEVEQLFVQSTAETLQVAETDIQNVEVIPGENVRRTGQGRSKQDEDEEPVPELVVVFDLIKDNLQGDPLELMNNDLFIQRFNAMLATNGQDPEERAPIAAVTTMYEPNSPKGKQDNSKFVAIGAVVVAAACVAAGVKYKRDRSTSIVATAGDSMGAARVFVQQRGTSVISPPPDLDNPHTKGNPRTDSVLSGGVPQQQHAHRTRSVISTSVKPMFSYEETEEASGQLAPTRSTVSTSAKPMKPMFSYEDTEKSQCVPGEIEVVTGQLEEVHGALSRDPSTDMDQAVPKLKKQRAGGVLGSSRSSLRSSRSSRSSTSGSNSTSPRTPTNLGAPRIFVPQTVSMVGDDEAKPKVGGAVSIPTAVNPAGKLFAYQDDPNDVPDNVSMASEPSISSSRLKKKRAGNEAFGSGRIFVPHTVSGVDDGSVSPERSPAKLEDPPALPQRASLGRRGGSSRALELE